MFVFDNNTLSNLGSLIEVSIFNEDYSNRKLFDRSVNNYDALENERILDRVVLLYRRRGDWNPESWTEAILVDKMDRPLEVVDILNFSTEGVEDELGYAMLHWNVSDVPDSTYQVKVQSRCETLDNSHNELNYYNTETIEFVFDTTPPAIYGSPQI